MKSFTAILRSTLESVPQGVFNWPADSDKVDNFNIEIKRHGLDARRFHYPRIEVIRRSCRHAVKLSRAFLVSKKKQSTKQIIMHLSLQEIDTTKMHNLTISISLIPLYLLVLSVISVPLC